MSKKHHPSQETENGMVRGLQNRHVQLIAIAGTIGTGLFLGAGRSLSLTGPSIILVYMLTGAFMYLMMRAIGEMLYMDPDQHTFINFITKYIGKVGVIFQDGPIGSPWYFWEWQRSPLFPTMSSFGFQIGQPGRFKLSF